MEDEPFSISPPYIHFKNGRKIFTEEINELYGENKYSKNLAKKLIKVIDKNNYRTILYQEKINILYKIFGWTDYGTNIINIINNLVVYEIII